MQSLSEIVHGLFVLTAGDPNLSAVEIGFDTVRITLQRGDELGESLVEQLRRNFVAEQAEIEFDGTQGIPDLMSDSRG